MSKFLINKKKGNKIIKTNDLSLVFDNWKNQKEHWLFISPHDDDIVIGSGILLQKAKSENINITVLITTDGRMGYCSLFDKENIIEIRHNETLKSFRILNIDDIYWLNFPDCLLYSYMGRKKSIKNDPCIIEDYTGLQNAYTYYLRKISPTRIFLPSGSDLHIDHKIVYQEVLMSLFHATSFIWPELGKPLLFIPNIYEMAIYCNFNESPNIKVSGTQKYLDNKLESIKAYISQKKIIDSLVSKIRESGPFEYFREINFNLYSPDYYKNFF